MWRSPHEVTLVEGRMDASWLENAPERFVGDKPYDLDKLDERLAEAYSPNRSNIKPVRKAQDGRALRRYNRWKVERINAWLQNFSGRVMRWEYKAENYAGFVLLACLANITRNIDF